LEPVSDDYRNKLWNHSCSIPSEFLGNYDYENGFYAFQHGLVQMIVLNSYTDVTLGSAQYVWLESELGSVDRTVTPWLVVSFHAPIYNTFSDHINETEALRMREAVESLFVHYNVNLIISGHVHAYMRTHSLAFGNVDDTGKSPIYIIIGARGNREGHAHGYQHGEPEAWVAKRDNKEYGYGQLHFANASHAHWSRVRDGTTIEAICDQVWITNPHM
jgi:acid phosphatase type 7